jgi:hypothetical protein
MIFINSNLIVSLMGVARVPMDSSNSLIEQNGNIGSTMNNYIGITGLVSVDEVEGTIALFENAGITMDSDPKPMLGFLISYKNLDGSKHSSKRYPLLKDIPKLLRACDGRVIPTIHFNTKYLKKGEYSEDYEEEDIGPLADQIRSFLNFSDIYKSGLCREVQLNVPRLFEDEPTIQMTEMRKLRKRYPDLSIILQVPVNNKILRGMNNVRIMRKINNYHNEIGIERLLFDPSAGGRDLPSTKIDQGPSTGYGDHLDLDKAQIFYYSLRENRIPSMVGFAGGLKGSNIKGVLRSLRHRIRTKDFSIDAESGVRNLDDEFDPLLAESYINEAAKGFDISPLI